MTDQKLVVIVGPTSSGKTSAAVKLCHKFNGEIVSADSRQIYRFMNVGTGKIPFGTVVDVPVWLYDVVKPGDYFSADDFRKQAGEIIKDIWSRHKVPFVVGGTGFYIEALLGSKTTASVPPDFELRKELELLSTEELAERLESLDQKRYDVIDRNNRRRLVRAIEVATIKVGVDQRVDPEKKGEHIGSPLRIGFNSSHDYLYHRADAWVESAFQNGLIEETQKLVEMGYKDTPQLQGLIYKTVLQQLAGQLSLEEAKQRVKFDLHSYIRRQETYFRKMSDLVQIDISDQAFDEKLITRVESYLDG